ncbi:MAG: phage late control D family protein [bacterium]
MVTPDYIIKLDGKEIENSTRASILEVNCDLQLRIASELCLVIHDPDFKITSAGTFRLGVEIELKIGFGSDFYPMMLGEIVSIEPQLSEASGSLLIVRAYDKSYRLRRHKPARPAFLEMRDSDIAEKICRDAGLHADIEQTPIKHEYLQQTGSNWRFLKNRAAANGYELYMHLDTLAFRHSRESTVHSVRRGEDLLQLKLRLSAVDQPNVHVVRGWDAKQKQSLVGKTSQDKNEATFAKNKLGAKITAEAFGESRSVLFDAPPVSQEEADHRAKAEFKQKARSFVEGEGLSYGNPEMKAGDKLELHKMGDPFSGKYDLIQVRHVINGHTGYRTKFSIEKDA